MGNFWDRKPGFAVGHLEYCLSTFPTMIGYCPSTSATMIDKTRSEEEREREEREGKGATHTSQLQEFVGFGNQ